MARILVIDDEIHIRMLYKKEFEADGYQVETASNPREAWEAIGKGAPDVIILDIELDDASGLELLNHIRQKMRLCPVILNSAYASYKNDFQSWLADAYIMKSSNLNPLKEMVRDLLTKGTCDARA